MRLVIKNMKNLQLTCECSMAYAKNTTLNNIVDTLSYLSYKNCLYIRGRTKLVSSKLI